MKTAVSEPNVRVTTGWVLSAGRLTGRPAELSGSQGRSGWTDTEADSSSTPASPVHLSPPGSHRGTSHSSVSTCSAQFGRRRVSNRTSNWPPKSNICHAELLNLNLKFVCFSLFLIHDIYSDLYESTLVIPCLSVFIYPCFKC